MNQKQEKATFAEIVKAEKQIRQIKKKHSAIFKRLAALEEKSSKLSADLKSSIRPRIVAEAKQGLCPFGKVDLYAQEGALVQAVIRRAALAYDIEKAWLLWPRVTFREVTSIDPKRVEALINEGKLSEAKAGDALIERGEPSAAITIEVFDVSGGDAGPKKRERRARVPRTPQTGARPRTPRS